jgi:hypothetical protein
VIRRDGEPPTPTEKQQKSIVKRRPFAVLEREMTKFEQRMANGAPQTAADAERDARDDWLGSMPRLWSSKC